MAVLSGVVSVAWQAWCGVASVVTCVQRVWRVRLLL